MRELEDWERSILVLSNGKTIDVPAALIHCDNTYRLTKTTYNLSTRRPIVAGRRPTERDIVVYTHEEANWMHQHTVQEIAQRWNTSITAATRMKNYVPFINGITEKPGTIKPP